MAQDQNAPLPPAEFRVLLSLLDGPKHGHSIKLDIRERTGGRIEMGPGTLYGAIKRLAGREWIAEVDHDDSETDGRRRYYTLTDTGRTVARSEMERMAELLEIGRAKGLNVGFEV